MGAALALMMAGILLTATPSLVVTVIGIAGLTCGFFGAHAIASSWVTQRATTARAQAASMYLFAYYVGSSVFGSLGGLFFSRFGWLGIVGLVACLTLAALGLAHRLSLREEREHRARDGVA